jgi:hypothetical protein
VIDLSQVELSSGEDPRIAAIAEHSETEHILTDGSFQTPPAIPFGQEPDHGWCYFYEKAAYARQQGDWIEVARLAKEANSRRLLAGDPVEWMPFLQAHAYFDHISQLEQIAPLASADPVVAEQVCLILTGMQLKAATEDEVKRLFCAK